MQRPTKPQRLSKPALFEAIGYTPHEGQVPIHRSKARFRVVCCGTRFGKTTLAVAEAVAAILSPCPRSLGWTIAPTLDLARLVFDRVAADVQEYFPSRIKELSLREQRLVVVNLAGGVSELRGKTADHPASLLGAAVDWMVVDEATRMRKEIWEQHLAPRLIDRRGWALLTSTPNGHDWFAKLHRRGQRNRDAEFESWTMPSWLNPHVPREMIEAEKSRQSDESYRAQYGAEFVGESDDSCDSCGGPAFGLPGVILQRGDEPLARCPECNDYTDAMGKTIVPRWRNGERGTLTILSLCPRSDGTVPEPIRPGECADELPRVIGSGAAETNGIAG